MQVCLGCVCFPVTAIWPLILFAIKYLWDKVLRRLLLRGNAPDQSALADDDTEPLPQPVDVSSGKSDSILPASQTVSYSRYAIECTAAAASRPLFVDFSATWCGPCKQIAPFFGQLASKYQSSADFVKVDIDELTDLADAANIKAVPSFQVYRDKVLVDRITGADQGSLRRLVETHVKKSS